MSSGKRAKRQLITIRVVMRAHFSMDFLCLTHFCRTQFLSDTFCLRTDFRTHFLPCTFLPMHNMPATHFSKIFLHTFLPATHSARTYCFRGIFYQHIFGHISVVHIKSTDTFCWHIYTALLNHVFFRNYEHFFIEKPTVHCQKI